MNKAGADLEDFFRLSMNSQLAIVIPAYRARFLARTLASIAAQTDQRFNLYIGDDASLEPVAQTVQNAGFSKERLVYHRFDRNMGGTSLAQHWDRCIRLGSEPWVWLFSDDDVMDPDCVKAFYRTLEATGGAFDVYRFDTLFIDENDRPLRLSPPHPQQEGWMEYAYFLLRDLRTSTAQEVIFSRAAYERSGGFINFPLAWGSDHASQMTWAVPKGLRRIEGARVRWRWSGQNISSTRERKLKMTKVHASMQFVEWLLQRVQEIPDQGFPLPIGVFKPLAREWFLQHLTHMHQCLGQRECFSSAAF